MLWTLHQLQQALGLEKSGEDVTVSGISIDTRSLEKGDLFVALQAERDGHDFIPMAVEKGAAACLVSKHTTDDISELVVKDTLASLTLLAQARVAAHTGKRIAITGSCGKTSLTHMLATICDAHKPEQSFNNHWGVPLTLARMPQQKDVAITEIGTNHAGEISPLSKLTKPHVAIITNIAPAHIGNFNSLEDLATEKLSIQDGLIEGGTLIIHADIKKQWPDKIKAETLTFGLEGADVYLVSKNQSQVTIATPVEEVTFELPVSGEHQLLNALAAVAALYTLGLPMSYLENMHSLEELAGRGRIKKVAGITLLDDSFNANPLSMKVAINRLKEMPSDGRKLAILGDMLELGADSPKYHADLSTLLDGVDGVITVGENMQFLEQRLPEHVRLGHYNSVQDMDVAALSKQLKKDDTVLVKGSKGIFWVSDFIGKLTSALT